MTARSAIIAAASSGSGKTTVTLALLVLLAQRGHRVASCKIGPDYIDPAFHARVTGRACYNLDGWAMRPETLAALVARAAVGSDLLVVEGVMGLFDGAPVQSDDLAALAPGSTAQVAATLGLPVILVLRAKGIGATAAALLQGLKTHHRGVDVAGVIFNEVGGDRHRDMLARAARQAELPVLGYLPGFGDLALPSRHLGLVQAEEHADITAYAAQLAQRLAPHLDLEALAGVMRAPAGPGGNKAAPMPPLGQRIAVARDIAFGFAYAATLEGWRDAGAEVSFFSPLADETPPASADAVFLPGGYPELQAGRLAANRKFLDGLRQAAARGASVYGECGGYMVLGEGLIDAAGDRHAMAGLLPVVTSFAARRLHLGYRGARLLDDGPLGKAGAAFRGHEFHYARVVSEGDSPALFAAQDALCRDLGSLGRRQGCVAGSFLHLIDQAP
jgi:cobyrinic acid a,c-diamide synthase